MRSDVEMASMNAQLVPERRGLGCVSIGRSIERLATGLECRHGTAPIPLRCNFRAPVQHVDGLRRL
jgi:hypothetical protein